MKIELPIGIRRFGSTLVIAEVLDSLPMSAAAATVDEAVAKLAEGCRAALERTHPRVIAQMGRAPKTRVESLDWPLLKRREDDEADGDGAREYLARRTYLYERHFQGVLETGVVGLGNSTWVAVSPGAPAPVSQAGVAPNVEAARTKAHQRLQAMLRRHERTTLLHRAIPDEVYTRELAVEFEPLDLTRMPTDALWMDTFGEIEAEDEDGQDTSTLREVARDWTLEDPQARRQRGIVATVGREDIVDQLAQLLGASRPAAVVLVGPARVGKTSIVKHLAWLSATAPARLSTEAQAPLHGARRRVWFADAPRMTSTDPMSPGWQEQCARLVAELEARDDVLYFGRLVQALDAGKFVGSDYNLAQFLKPHLSDRRLRVVAEATPEEWTRIEQRDVGFARAFHVVRVADPPDAQALEIVAWAARRMSEQERIALDEAAVERAWRLQQRFATEGSPLGRAIDFVGRTLRRAAQTFATRVDEVALVERFCEETGLPPVMLLDDQSLDLAQVQQRLGRRVVGQEDAVRRIANVVGITKAGLAPADRPLGSFFFVGPTGVGKTELARALAEFLFGDEDRLVRLDMSEYAHPDAYTRLIGGGGQEGELTGPVRRQPFSVILLDEVEKADPGVYDLLLQVLGEARLSDAEGRTTRFQNTIVIMTSNLGVDTLRPAIGFGGAAGEDSAEHHFRKEAERYFRPEFLARIDQFIPFRSLSRPAVEAIARRELHRMVARAGLSARDIQAEFGDDVVAWVAEAGWDTKYGARPIKRVVEQQVAWPMARRLAAAGALDADLAHRMRIGVDAVGAGGLTFALESHALGAQSRRAMLAQIERIAGLRRRLERCMHSEIYAELAWWVHDFDVSSQAEGFWELPDAADTARAAEQGRALLGSAEALSAELEAIEDLVRESYQVREFALSQDVDQRVEELAPRLKDLVLTLLRSAQQEPDAVALFLPATDPQDPWRARLIGWYRQLADQRGWQVQMRRALPRPERPNEDAIAPEARRALLWAPTDKPSGSVVVLEFAGEGVRPLLLGEDGLHRMISEDGNAVIDVMVLGDEVDWPRPSDLEGARPLRPDARVWNFRTGQVTMHGVGGLVLDPANPWRTLWAPIEEIAWELAGGEWW